MTKNNQFSPEVRQRATRLVFESQHEYSSQWAAICSVAQKIGCSPETLRAWIRQQERDAGGGDGGLTTTERQRLKELERETLSCGAATIFCGRPPLILRRRSSTASGKNNVAAGHPAR